MNWPRPSPAHPAVDPQHAAKPAGQGLHAVELEQIATLVRRSNAYVLSDEVYEWMTYPDGANPVEHVRIATLPGMWERTITLGSAGKTFSVTGWKIGWAIADAPLAWAIYSAHQWIPFTVATPLQEAVAIALQQATEDGYFAWLGEMYRGKRDRLYRVLDEIGLNPVKPDGSYFILFDTARWMCRSRRATAATTPSAAGSPRRLASRHPAQPVLQPAAQYLTDNLRASLL